MSWRDLLQTTDETVRLPWVGGRSLRTWERAFRLDGPLPAEHGWCLFKITAARVVRLMRPAPACELTLRRASMGYLVGDRLVRDEVRVETDPDKLVAMAERVHLIEPGLGRFTRVAVGRAHEGGPLIFQGQEMPLGPEESVLQAFLDAKATVDDVPGVVPALDVAFRFETWQRAEVARRREEERLRRERDDADRAARERMVQLREQLGTGQGRRAMALTDFAEAARAALAVAGAEYLDHRKAYQPGEMVVQFRFDRRRYECTCDARTLRIIDAGICLTDHRTGEKGDARFTLESLPDVIRQAIAEDKLVVWRHVD